MFGKYFERPSLPTSEMSSHNSIWTESESSTATGPESEHDHYILTKFNSCSASDDGSDCLFGVDANPTSNHSNVARLGAHMMETSFASTVSLGSESHYATDKWDTARVSTRRNSLNLLAVAEEDETDEKNECPLKLSFASDTLTVSESTDSGELKLKGSRPRIHRLLLDPKNQPVAAIKCLESAWNVVDPFTDLDMMLPEPTAIEKLKYHLTEARFPPKRRKTYNYSHI